MMYINTEESFWSLLTPAFGVYGQFLATLFMVLGFFTAQSASKYQILKEKYDHQEKSYLRLKMFMEREILPEDEKEKLSSILEILELRFKGISLLQNKIEFYPTKKSGATYLKPEFGKAIECFHQAVDLSSDKTILISEKDFDLASRIIIGNDKKVALSCLNEIRSHTDIFLTELLFNYRYRKFTPNTSEWKQKIASSYDRSQSTLQSSQRYPTISELKEQTSSSSGETESAIPEKDENLL